MRSGPAIILTGKGYKEHHWLVVPPSTTSVTPIYSTLTQCLPLLVLSPTPRTNSASAVQWFVSAVIHSQLRPRSDLGLVNKLTGDPLTTPAMIRSRPHQQADRQHLTSTARPLYPIAIDRDRRPPLTHSSPSILSSSLSLSVRVLSPKVLVPLPFCSRKPRTLIANASITMSRHRSLQFATPHYDPQRLLSSLLLVPPTLVPDSPRASSPPRYPPSLS